MGRTGWSISAGVVFAGAAIIAAPLAGLELAGAFNTDGAVSWASLLLGVFVTGTLVWWLLHREQGELALLRGAITGVFVAIFSYPVVILVSQALHRDWSLIVSPATTIEQLLSALLLALVALVSTGPAAIAVMAAAGALAAILPARLAREKPVVRRSAVDWVLWLATTLAVGIVVAITAAFVWLTLIPLDTSQLARHADAGTPAADHQAAMAMFAEVEADESRLPLDPRCHSALLTHGRKVAKAVVFFHGLTNCPAQGNELAAQLYALGYNVYTPRLPEHGEADVMTTALAQLTAGQMIQTGDQAIDLAHGLGDEVLVFGLSAGGTLATWTAQTRSDVGNAIAISPFLGAHAIPPWATRAATNLLLILPNMMMWWDGTHAEPAGMDYAYPRFATHGLAQMIRLGALVEDLAHHNRPAAAQVGLLLNDADTAVNNVITEQLAATWQGHGATVARVTLPLADGLPHDVIDPHQPAGNIGVVYPAIIDMLGK